MHEPSIDLKVLSKMENENFIFEAFKIQQTKSYEKFIGKYIFFK